MEKYSSGSCNTRELGGALHRQITIRVKVAIYSTIYNQRQLLISSCYCYIASSESKGEESHWARHGSSRRETEARQRRKG